MNNVWVVNKTQSPISITIMEMHRNINFAPNTPVKLPYYTGISTMKRYKGLAIIDEAKALQMIVGKRHLITRWLGIGDLLLLEPLIRKQKERYPNMPIDVFSQFPELFENNQSIDHAGKISSRADVHTIERKDYVFETHLTDYSETAASRGTKHRTDVFNEKFKLEMTAYEKEPRLYMGRSERNTSFKRVKGMRYIGVQFDASCDMRRIKNGKEIISRLLEKDDICVVVFGNKRYLECEENPRVIDLQGKTTLRKAILAINQLDGFIAGDSGLMHVALTLHVPTVCLFGAITPELRIRYYTGKYSVIAPKCAGCGDVHGGVCRKKTLECLSPRVDDVSDSLFSMIDKQDNVSQSKHCVFVVNFPKGKNEVYEASIDSTRRYAKRIGSDFYVHDTKSINISEWTPHVEKFYIAKLLERYERVLYVDCDILIKDTCENLFETYKDDAVYMLSEVDGNGVDMNKSVESLIAKHGLSGWEKSESGSYEYYNTGVILASKKHKSAFTVGSDYFTHIYEQSYLNYALMKHGIDIKKLDVRHNTMLNFHDENDGDIVHYTELKDHAGKLMAAYKSQKEGIEHERNSQIVSVA